MAGEETLAGELKKYKNICFYPSSGKDLSDLDYFCSGGRLWEERLSGSALASGNVRSTGGAGDAGDGFPPVEPQGILDRPDLHLHTDVNFYQEFVSGLEIPPEESGLHGGLEVLAFRELPVWKSPNAIFDNYPHSGRCFEYRVRTWGSTTTLMFCLCENEALVARVLLPQRIPVSRIWSRNWAGGKTYGTWLVNVLERLGTRKVYTDWLCVPGRRGEPRNRLVEEKYPELIAPTDTRLVRNEQIHWIDEGAHGWVEEYDVIHEGAG